MDLLDKYSILFDNQHGFHSKRSCETQLVITIEEIARKLANGEQVDIILLDLLSPFLKTGTMDAARQSLGMVPLSSESWNMHRSIGDSSSAKSWRTLAGISKY
jgi:hypothetical protein